MIETKTTHAVEQSEMRDWLKDHGLDIDTLKSLSIRLDRPIASGHPIWLDVVFYKTDEHGKLFVSAITREAAVGTASIPVKHFPKLTALTAEQTEVFAQVLNQTSDDEDDG